MKIAVFHNFLDNIGGAEIVALTLAKELNADFYTTNIDKEKIAKMGFEDVLPRLYSIGKIPINAPFKQQFAFWKFRRLNLGKKYDFYIISGDWAMSAAVNNKPNLWYVHSPLNELWQFKDYIKDNVLTWWERPLFDIWVLFNRKLSLRYAEHIERWVCNSENTKKRILRYYRKKAVVINPPINNNYRYLKSKNYWLSVNRLINAKRIELQIKAFSKLAGENLIIVGSYEKGARQFEDYKNFIEKIRPQNVKIINWVDDKKLKELYSECKGFITTTRDEDFGLTPVEAMASGKPIIACNEGGYKETIINGKTGILIDDINEEKLADAIRKMSEELKSKKNQLKYKEACQKQAKRFDVKVFIEKIKMEIER